MAHVIADVVANPDPPVRVRTSDWVEQFCSLKTSADPEGKKLQHLIATDTLGAKSTKALK